MIYFAAAKQSDIADEWKVALAPFKMHTAPPNVPTGELTLQRRIAEAEIVAMES